MNAPIICSVPKEVKTAFLFNMTDESRTALNAIRSHPNRLLEGADGDPTGEQERLGMWTRGSAKDLSEPVNHLLDLANGGLQA
jgi:hypothetical protein